MKLSLLDTSIILVYLVAIITIGFIMKKQAAKTSNHIFWEVTNFPGTCSDFPTHLVCSIFQVRCGW